MEASPLDRRIDLNADIGEGQDDEPLLQIVSSVSVASGGHAGDEQSIEAAIRAAKQHHVRIGVHPSYPDPEGFGRAAFNGTLHEIRHSLVEQLDRMMRVADRLRASVTHCKPHGRLYMDAAGDPILAGLVAESIADRHPELRVYALAGSALVDACRDAGLDVYEEAFADRAYLSDGTLKPRSESGALITDPDEAATHALRLVTDGEIRTNTICVHGDTPGALAIARAVRAALEAGGFTIDAGI